MKVKFFNSTRTDRQLALVLFALVFGLYVRTAAPGLLNGDSGEFQTAAWTLGIAHATGYPLYLLLGSLWQHVLALFGLTPAYTLNLLSALFGALTVAVLYLTLVDWLQSSATVRRMAALLAATLLAVNPTFWSQSLIAEVYTLHAFFVILLLQAAHRLSQWHRHPDTHHAQLDADNAWPLVLLLGALTGFALTHHAMTLWLLPGIGVALWLSRRWWLTSVTRVGLLALVTLAPLLLYFYIPLRSGPAASPWYHQALGAETLTLYQPGFAGFWQFFSGESISVGFRDWGGALAQLSQSLVLWRLHFFLPGLVMVGLGVYVLWRARNWPVLLLTLPFFLLQQIFNLFYAIGDILVYYVPLYLIATIWVAFSADTIAGGFARMEAQSEAEQEADDRRPALAISVVLVFVLFWLPLQVGRTYLPQLDQSTTTGARQRWETIADATPPADAILVSNDRNEIVPLFYYQAVEGRLRGVTGLFPQIAPDARFADIGTTLDTALAAGDQPVYLIKPMPGLESRFTLQPVTEPLIAVQPLADTVPTYTVDRPYGPLQLLGYDWLVVDDEILVTLHWRVNATLDREYTTTVQVFDGAGDKLAQHDAPPGGNYYPTKLWKVGERLVERHLLDISGADEAATLLVAMYEGATLAQLAPPIEIQLTE